MQTYDPSASSFINEIRTPTVEEELARKPPKKEGVPTGLLEPEKKIEESQMADFSTPIDELMAGGEEPQAPMMTEMQSAPQVQSSKKLSIVSSKNPFGLTDEQFQAVLAGVAAVLAFSKPVQERLSSMVPNYMGQGGETTMTGLIVTALVVAILFYFAKKFLMDKN